MAEIGTGKNSSPLKAVNRIIGLISPLMPQYRIALDFHSWILYLLEILDLRPN